MKRVIEFEIEGCVECPNFMTCFITSKGEYDRTQFGYFADCPFPWHEKGYDRAAELEEEIAALKRQLNGDNWIPVESAVKPRLEQEIIVSTLNKSTGKILQSINTYYGHFYETENYKDVAWQPYNIAPYKPQVKKMHADYTEAIMKRFMRVK